MSETATPVTRVDFVTVPTRDFEESFDFYDRVLGLPCSVRYGRAPGAEFETGNLTLSVVESEKMGFAFSANGNPIALHVDDVEAARAELTERGVEFAGDTLDTGVCHMALFRDPAGNALMLHHRYAPRTPEG